MQIPGELPRREGLRDSAGDPFGTPAAPPPAPVAAAAPPPAPPPMPYRYAGTVRQDGALQVMLARDNKLFPARAGDVLEDGYKVEAVRADAITLINTRFNTTTTIEFTSPLAEGAEVASVASSVKEIQAKAPPGSQPAGQRPAKLAWDGPQQVKAGSQFTVVLRLTSEQPVSASPMLLRFDPAVLEPVGVRAGTRYAAQRGFNYRVNPDGSIFIGASSASPASAADAEVIVLTFRPLRAGGMAEISIASLSLQGAAGRAIDHEQLAAFRASIGR